MTDTKCRHSWEMSNNDNLLDGKEVRYCHQCKAVQIKYNSCNPKEDGFVDVPLSEYPRVLSWILWEVGR